MVQTHMLVEYAPQVSALRGDGDTNEGGYKLKGGGKQRVTSGGSEWKTVTRSYLIVENPAYTFLSYSKACS